MTTEKPPQLIIVIPIFAAALVIVVICNTIFVTSKDELTPVAASAFAVAGLIAIMPWQLAQALGEKASERVQKGLIDSGCNMAASSLLFMAASILRFFYFHAQEMLSLSDHMNEKVTVTSGVLSTGSFALASVFCMIGVVWFSAIMSSMIADDPKKPNQ